MIFKTEEFNVYAPVHLVSRWAEGEARMELEVTRSGRGIVYQEDFMHWWNSMGDVALPSPQMRAFWFPNDSLGTSIWVRVIRLQHSSFNTKTLVLKMGNLVNKFSSNTDKIKKIHFFSLSQCLVIVKTPHGHWNTFISQSIVQSKKAQQLNCVENTLQKAEFF